MNFEKASLRVIEKIFSLRRKYQFLSEQKAVLQSEYNVIEAELEGYYQELRKIERIRGNDWDLLVDVLYNIIDDIECGGPRVASRFDKIGNKIGNIEDDMGEIEYALERMGDYVSS